MLSCSYIIQPLYRVFVIFRPLCYLKEAEVTRLRECTKAAAVEDPLGFQGLGPEPRTV